MDGVASVGVPTDDDFVVDISTLVIITYCHVLPGTPCLK